MSVRAIIFSFDKSYYLSEPTVKLRSIFETLRFLYGGLRKLNLLRISLRLRDE